MAEGQDVERRYAFDTRGIRRFVRAGDELPPGWRWEEAETTPEPESHAEPEAEPKPVRGKRPR